MACSKRNAQAMLRAIVDAIQHESRDAASLSG